jgi:hypothetical protein
MGNRSKLLIDSNENMTFNQQLAVVVGDRQAIALQQIHYWCDLNARMKRRSHFFDDHWWVYNTWADWKKENFPYWSISTIRRIFDDLSGLGLIAIRPHKNNRNGSWITVNYSQVEIYAQKKGRIIKARKPKNPAEINRVTASDSDATLFNLNTHPVQNEQPTGNTETTQRLTIKNLSAPDGAGVGDSDSNSQKEPTSLQGRKAGITDTSSRSSEEESADSSAPPPAPNPYNLLVQAVSVYFFDTNPSDVGQAKIGGRIGKIAGWLYGTSAPSGMTRINHPAEPRHVAAYAKWWKKAKRGATLPKDPIKFIEGWREWVSSLKPVGNGRVISQENETSEQAPQDWTVSTYAWYLDEEQKA